MTTTTKIVLSALIAAVIAGGVYGGYTYLLSPKVEQLAGASAVGTTFQTAKIAQVSVAPATPGTNATSTSILNTDANDRYILSEEVGCEVVGTSKTAYTGTGLAALTLTMATSSTVLTNSTGLGQTVGGVALTIATSSAFFTVASSTSGVGNAAGSSNVWAAGSYLTMQFNATNTAACVIGVRYMSS